MKENALVLRTSLRKHHGPLVFFMGFVSMKTQASMCLQWCLAYMNVYAAPAVLCRRNIQQTSHILSSSRIISQGQQDNQATMSASSISCVIWVSALQRSDMPRAACAAVAVPTRQSVTLGLHKKKKSVHCIILGIINKDTCFQSDGQVVNISWWAEITSKMWILYHTVGMDGIQPA